MVESLLADDSIIRPDDYVLYLETLHGTTLKTLFEALKDMLTDVNLNFHHKKVGILKMDEGRTLLVYLKLYADQFKPYYIADPMVAGIQISSLYKHLKTLSPNDILRLAIHKETCNTLSVVIANAERGRLDEYSLDLLDINEDELTIPDLDFSFMITMNPLDFQKICRDLKLLGVEKVEIAYSKQCLSFMARGEGSNVKMSRQQGKDKLSITNNEGVSEDEIYRGVFELNKLCHFAKCAGLSSELKMLIKNDYPLVFKYEVGDLGEIQLCLAPANNAD